MPPASLSENDDIVSRYMDDQQFQNAVFPLLAQDIFDKIRHREA